MAIVFKQLSPLMRKPNLQRRLRLIIMLSLLAAGAAFAPEAKNTVTYYFGSK